jgi:hypothetical protein
VQEESDCQRSVRVRSCIRPVVAWRITSVAMQPLWPLHEGTHSAASANGQLGGLPDGAHPQRQCAAAVDRERLVRIEPGGEQLPAQCQDKGPRAVMPAAVQTVEPTSSARSGLLRGGGPPCVAIFLVLSEGSQQLHFHPAAGRKRQCRPVLRCSRGPRRLARPHRVNRPISSAKST